MPSLSKAPLDEDVLTLARRRIALLYDRFDLVTLLFSGGKDSTVCLNLLLEEAGRRDRLPLEVSFFDEEAIHPETVEYVERVRERPDVRLAWYCLPVKHRNACSRRQLYWHPWNPAERELWCRPLPEGALLEHPGFRFGMTHAELGPFLHGPERGSVASVMGIRADESLRRYRIVARRMRENWLMPARKGYACLAYPIYDWTTFDVWTAPRLMGWDWNRTYDCVEWVDRATLRPNDYNPNAVAPPELDLLLLSILEDGFTQPLVVLDDGSIVDGFHRWVVAGDERLLALYGGMVPVVRLRVCNAHSRFSTVRHNRARGTHGVLKMAAIVRELLDGGLPRAEVERRLGMEDEEVERLVTRAPAPERLGRGFGKGWTPGPR